MCTPTALLESQDWLHQQLNCNHRPVRSGVAPDRSATVGLAEARRGKLVKNKLPDCGDVSGTEAPRLMCCEERDIDAGKFIGSILIQGMGFKIREESCLSTVEFKKIIYLRSLRWGGGASEECD
ncbi:hypothetical protein J6590_009101 [Homalodisca vitripennis]|nr:hypothetical protein J6590_009101 [Homalodisca vitripennis]